MSTIALVTCLVAVAAAWGGWPLVARTAGEAGVPGALVMSVAMLVVVGLAALVSRTAAPGVQATAVLAGAGAMMGVGMIAFNALATSPDVEISTVVPIADTGMLLVAVVGGILFFDEPVTARKLLGLALLLAGIFVLSPKS